MLSFIDSGPVIWCCVFAVIFAIFTKVCRVFYHFLPWFSTIPIHCCSCVATRWASCWAVLKFWTSLMYPSILVSRSTWTHTLDNLSIFIRPYCVVADHIYCYAVWSAIGNIMSSVCNAVHCGAQGQCGRCTFGFMTYFFSLSLQQSLEWVNVL